MKKWKLRDSLYIVLILIGVIDLLGMWVRNDKSTVLYVVDAALIVLGGYLLVKSRRAKNT
jgi:hypothetical protein